MRTDSSPDCVSQPFTLSLTDVPEGRLEAGCGPTLTVCLPTLHTFSQMYLKAVLRQDVEYFDTQATTGSLLQGLNEDGTAIQQVCEGLTQAFF